MEPFLTDELSFLMSPVLIKYGMSNGMLVGKAANIQDPILSIDMGRRCTLICSIVQKDMRSTISVWIRLIIDCAIFGYVRISRTSVISRCRETIHLASLESASIHRVRSTVPASKSANTIFTLGIIQPLSRRFRLEMWAWNVCLVNTVAITMFRLLRHGYDPL